MIMRIGLEIKDFVYVVMVILIFINFEYEFV